MATDRFVNTHHNASTPPPVDVSADLAAFMVAIDPILFLRG